MDETKSIEELMALYELEPSVTDIYVEGDTDKYFVEWFLFRHHWSHVNVYSIDIVEVPDEVLRRHNLPIHSNRSKVIALSLELFSRFDTNIKVMCIADRDFEDALPSVSPPPILHFTDGNSLETYSFNQLGLSKLVSVVLGGFPISPAEMQRCLAEVLRQVYAIRMANVKLKWNMEDIPFTRYVEIAGTRIQFNAEAFTRAYIQKNDRWKNRSQFERVFKECLLSLTPDDARNARGHDLCELILHLVRRLRRDRKFGNRETLEGVLLGAVETADLEAHPLFQGIRTLGMANN